MNTKDKIKKLAEKYKVEKGDKSNADWIKSIKKAAGSEFESIEVLYDKAFAKSASATSSPVPTPKAEVIPPSKEVTVLKEAAQPINQQHTVDVAAPNLVFNLAPPTVQVNNGGVSWAHSAMRAAQYAFVFASGVSFGVLAVILKIKGV